MKRRQFLQAALAAGALSPWCGVSRLAYGAPTASHPLLVSLFLRGGADGLHLLGPAADPDYQGVRPPELRVMDRGSDQGWPLANSLDPHLDFRLHRQGAALAQLYGAGVLSFVHGVGLEDATRSHFVAQELVEGGLTEEKALSGAPEGWLSRALGHFSLVGPVPAFCAGTNTDRSLAGFDRVLSAPDLNHGLLPPWGEPTRQLLQASAEAGDSPVHVATRQTLALVEAVDGRLPRQGRDRIEAYVPGGKADYGKGGEAGRGLAAVARLARLDVGLQAACVDMGGWDTHEGQAGRFAAQMGQLSAALAAFHEDMAAANWPYVLVAMTEFGRRLRANKSGGTDHGHGACWLVMGQGVRGGRMAGRWPGLGTRALDQGVDLAVTTDYRQVLAEVVAACGWGKAAGPVPLPGSRPLGLFA